MVSCPAVSVVLSNACVVAGRFHSHSVSSVDAMIECDQCDGELRGSHQVEFGMIAVLPVVLLFLEAIWSMSFRSLSQKQYLPQRRFGVSL